MTLPRLLQGALDADPARALITFYDDSSGERTELSVATFANWVAKTANLMQDELGMTAGQRVAIRLPLHWQAAVWLAACWAVGAVAAPGADAADVAVVCSEDAAAPPAADEIVGLGLGPLGLPRRKLVVPAHVTVDYDRVVHGHGDRFAPVEPPGPDVAALALGATSYAANDLVGRARASAATWRLPPGGRLLVTGPLDHLEAVLAGLLVPLASGAGAVLCRHPDAERLPGRVVSERIAASLGPVPGAAVPGLLVV
ncbi:MAG: TIGR03089 family protein [Actinomycetes bacterium]